MCKMFTKLGQFKIRHRRWISCALNTVHCTQRCQKHEIQIFKAIIAFWMNECILHVLCWCSLPVLNCVHFVFSICWTKPSRKRILCPKCSETYLSKEFSSILRWISAVLLSFPLTIHEYTLYMCEFIEFERCLMLKTTTLM